MKRFLCLVFLLAAASASFGQLAGMNFNYTSLQNQYLCVNPVSGATTVLNAFAFDTGYWTGVLVSDVASNQAYAVSSGMTLYTFDLGTGAIKQSAPIGMLLIALAFNGKLVGIKTPSSVSYEFYSIDPVTGATTLLNTFAPPSSGYFSDSFITDLASGQGGTQGTAYFLGNNGMLQTFNVTSGTVLATTQLTGNIVSIAVAPAGKLIAVEFNSGQWGLYSINPTTGSSVLLSTFNPSSGISSGAFKSDVSANKAYLFSGSTFYTFDLSTGAVLGTPSTLGMQLQSFAVGTGTPCPVVRLLEVSTRGLVGTSNSVLISGFMVAGTVPMKIAARAIGPSLAASGVQGTLQNPILELYDGSTLLAINDDWQDTPSNQAAVVAAGLAPTDSRESALVQTLNPGPYTAIMRGQSGTTGVGLVEIYDVTQPLNSELVNLGSRAEVTSQSNVIIAGFILGGTGTTHVIVRGLGPSLAQFNINNPLADPIVEVFNSQGVSIGYNDNWATDPNASQVSAQGLAPTNSLEAAIALMPSPGAYTAVVTGQSGGTGIGLVEVYRY